VGLRVKEIEGILPFFCSSMAKPCIPYASQRDLCETRLLRRVGFILTYASAPIPYPFIHTTAPLDLDLLPDIRTLQHKARKQQYDNTH
jgi:hypothetical protein